MKLSNCSTSQDEILTVCASFGGKAAEAAEIAEDLNNQLTAATARAEEIAEDLHNQLTDADARIEDLNNQLKKQDDKIDDLNEQILNFRAT